MSAGISQWQFGLGQGSDTVQSSSSYSPPTTTKTRNTRTILPIPKEMTSKQTSSTNSSSISDESASSVVKHALFSNQITDHDEEMIPSDNFERTIIVDHMGELFLQPAELTFLNKYSDPSTKIDQLVLAANHNRVHKHGFMKGFTSMHQARGRYNPQFFGDRTGETIAMVEIPNGNDVFDTRDQDTYLAQLYDAFSAPLKLSAGPTLETMGEYYNSMDCKSSEGQWKCQLGVHGDSVGLYSQNLPRKTKWHLLVSSGTPQTGYELWTQYMHRDRDCHKEGKRLEIAEVIKDEKYKYAQLLGQRNAKKLLYKAACALGIDSSLDCVVDKQNWDGGYDGNGVRIEDELMVVPSMSFDTFVFDQCKRVSRPFVEFFSATTKVTAENSQFPLMVNPLEGAQLLDVKFKGTTSHSTIEHSAAVPINTGRLIPSSFLQDQGQDDQYSDDQLQTIWASHRTAYVPESDQLDNKHACSFMQNVYRSYDSDFEQSIESLGIQVNSQWGTLNPVAVIAGKRHE